MILSRSRRIVLLGATAVAALLLVVVLLATRSGTPAPSPSAARTPAGFGTALNPPRPLPPLRLLDEHGRSIAMSAFRGRWVVLAPAMTLCHEVCPMTTGAFTRLSAQLRGEGLGGRVVVAEVTVDPWRDTPARLRAYRRMTGASFTLLTGTPAEVARFWRFFGVYYRRVPAGSPPGIDWLTHRPETFDVQHSDGVFIVDPAGRERLADEGMPDVGGHLSQALRRLLDAEGRKNLAHPQLPWSAAQLLAELHRLMGASGAGGGAAGTASSSAR